MELPSPTTCQPLLLAGAMTVRSAHGILKIMTYNLDLSGGWQALGHKKALSSSSSSREGRPLLGKMVSGPLQEIETHESIIGERTDWTTSCAPWW